MQPGDRLKTLASAKMSAFKIKAGGRDEQVGSHYEMDQEAVEEIIKDWPDTPKRTATDMINRYGAPNEATMTQLFWYYNGPWKRTVVSRDEIPHNFPTPHTDFITQFIDYRVPPDLADEAILFDGSVLVDRTAGEVAARCDMEAMNILTLNLLNDIVTGRMTVDEARKRYAEEASAHMMNRPAPYTEKLVFQIPQGSTADLDEAMIGGSMMHQTIEKMKDVFKGPSH
jgi:hypothetical protein